MVVATPCGVYGRFPFFEEGISVRGESSPLSSCSSIIVQNILRPQYTETHARIHTF